MITLDIKGYPEEENLPEGYVIIDKEYDSEFDSDKGVTEYTIIIKRVSDNKYFKGCYTNWGHGNYEWWSIWEEVFPKQITTTIYE